MKDTDWHGVRGVNAELIREINSIKRELAEARKDAERWQMLPAFIEKYQINYVGLLSDINAELKEKP